MPFRGESGMDKRRQFVAFASAEGANVSTVCQAFTIARSTGYRVLERQRKEGDAGLLPRSRRPHTSPTRTSDAIEQLVVEVRMAHPSWGGRKIRASLLRHGMAETMPAPSTITEILRRHDLLDGPRTGYPRAYQRFEHEAPNQLWQMDFVGHLALATAARVHPLTILDDHSRFLISLVACSNERVDTVKAHLISCFRTYGLPDRILADNGPSWGTARPGSINRLEAWLLRLDVPVVHGRPRHPQTQGKVERCNQTIGKDVFGRYGPFPDLPTSQAALDLFREVYNTERPHDALGLAVPTDRYQPSPRTYPETLPPLRYPDTDAVRKVLAHGGIWFRNHWWYVSEAVIGETVGVRPTAIDGVFTVHYATLTIRTVDFREADR